MLTLIFQTLFTSCFALSKAVGVSLGFSALGNASMAVWFISLFVVFIISIKLTVGRVRSWIHFNDYIDDLVTTFIIKLTEFTMAMAAPNVFCRIPLSIGGRVSVLCVIYSLFENLIWLGLVGNLDSEDIDDVLGIEKCDELLATSNFRGGSRGKLLIISTSVAVLCLGILWMFLIPEENKHTFTQVVKTKDFIMDTFWNDKCHELKAKHLRVFSHTFRPPVEETKEWLRNWDNFYKDNDTWFVLFRDDILQNLDYAYLGKKFVKEFFQIYFWGRNEGHRKFRPLILSSKIMQPPTDEVTDWIASKWEEFHREKPIWFVENKGRMMMSFELYHPSALKNLGDERIKWGKNSISSEIVFE